MPEEAQEAAKSIAREKLVNGLAPGAPCSRLNQDFRAQIGRKKLSLMMHRDVKWL